MVTSCRYSVEAIGWDVARENGLGVGGIVVRERAKEAIKEKRPFGCLRTRRQRRLGGGGLPAQRVLATGRAALAGRELGTL